MSEINKSNIVSGKDLFLLKYWGFFHLIEIVESSENQFYRWYTLNKT